MATQPTKAKRPKRVRAVARAGAEAAPAPEPVLQTASAYAIRAELEELVLKDLLGPAGGAEEEIAEARVRERYLVGHLAPRRSRLTVGAEELDELADAGPDSPDDGATDLGVIQSTTLLASSLGLSFCVDGAAKSLRLTARWGHYERALSATLVKEGTEEPVLVWKRRPIEGTTTVALREGALPLWTVTEEFPDVTVRGRVRGNDGDWVVTLFLVNNQEERRPKDAAWVFQPELAADSPDGAAIFRRRLNRTHELGNADALTRQETGAMLMLYRRQVEFAVGHGVGSHWETAPGDPERAVRVMTKVVPAYEVPRQTPPGASEIPALAAAVLDMKALGELQGGELAAGLRPLADAYGAWIASERAKVDDPAEGLAEHRDAARRALANCEKALGRVREGIALLERDPQAAEAFRFANHCMWQQRVRTLHCRGVRKGERRPKDPVADLDVPASRTWYPFQMAFVLLNLPGLTDLHHADRGAGREATADLLWFPTGGGKTEAYLGLTAYTLALRRLQGTVEGRSGEHGVAVLMRYTLRLLTLQQFQRAATLICACEEKRRTDPVRWGEEPFRIGLWVGYRVTPSTTKDSEEAIRQEHGAWTGGGGSGTPAQLTSCPWCGTPIDPGKHIRVEAGASKANRTFMFCGDALGDCLFSQRQSPTEGIPALVVDEEIYRHPPSLLIATVDKFAQMPWKGAVQMPFGRVASHCSRHGFRSPEIEDSDSHPAAGNLPRAKTEPHEWLRPPDLIIQDELHLIHGPLGSMVGLYETAVDELCSWVVGGRKVRPKVVASTATIRRAADQTMRLFMRGLEVFPPHGTDITDNFFARQRKPSEENPGRLYLGICAIGRRYPAAVIRAYTAVLSAAQYLYERYDLAADPWMTLVGYFNSVREMGGTRRLVDDDIRTRLRDMDERGLAKRNPPTVAELTSRVNSADIPQVLDRLDVTFSKAAEKRRKAQRDARQQVESPPYDVMLATNMISVGVDVDRLGLMVVAGQPKTTAEYIQATSRVGRRFPGLVLTLYNWARPRDLSHYEAFEQYHATFYRHVESLTLTPFAARALDRGLSAVLVALARLQGFELNANRDAMQARHDHPALSSAIETIARRVGLVEENNGAEAEVRGMLAERKDLWLKQVDKAKEAFHLGYRDGRDGTTRGLLRPPGEGEWERFTCLNSLRDVEGTVHLILTEDPKGLDASPATGLRIAASDNQEVE